MQLQAKQLSQTSIQLLKESLDVKNERKKEHSLFNSTSNLMKKLRNQRSRRSGIIVFHCIFSFNNLRFSIVERQPIVFGQPPEWYTKFEEVREQRRLDKLMPPVNKIVSDFFNANEEQFVVEDKDSIVTL